MSMEYNNFDEAKKTDYDNICEFLKESGFRRVSVEGGKKSTFVNKDYSVHVTVEENQTELTTEQEELIKQRLRALGYMD
jgi:hypothetical protein